MGSLRILRGRQVANSSNTDVDSSSSTSAGQQTAKAQAQANANVNAVTVQTTQVVDDNAPDADASQTADANVKAAVATVTELIGDNTVTALQTLSTLATPDKGTVITTDKPSSTTSAAQSTITSVSSSAKATSGSSSDSGTGNSSSTGSTSASTASDSSRSASAATNTASAVTTTQTPSVASSLVPVTSVIDGSTITTEVIAVATTSSTDGGAKASASPHQDLSTTQEFFDNKAAVGGVFGAVGLVSLILLLAIVLKIVRYRARRNFERELDEQVEKETRAGTPFGFGKEDDDDLNMMGRPSGLADPEKAYGAGYASNNLPGQPYPFGNTAAYATYSSSAAAVQPAYYSPNSTGNGAPRRYPSQDTGADQFDSRYYNNLSGGSEPRRAGPRGSNGSYGTLNQPPMNAFSPVSGPNAGPVFAPATFNGNYGEYRNVSPPPASASVRSASPTVAPYGARPSTPSSLTPGGNTGFQPAAAAPPRNAFTPLGSRPDSPAILARYGQGRSFSRDDTYTADAYAAAGGGQYLRAPPASTNEPPSPKAALPNPFEQRD